MMTMLLWIRPVFAVMLLGLAGLYVWTAYRQSDDRTDGAVR
jgi:cytochrome c-type biogenesis protein CcmH/NrfF